MVTRILRTSSAQVASAGAEIEATAREIADATRVEQQNVEGFASSLAEMAALRLPTLLVPLPTAADNHQFFNAQLLVASGAARLLDQKTNTPAEVAQLLTSLMEDDAVRIPLQAALARWHAPQSAAEIAASIIRQSTQTVPLTTRPAAAKILTT